MKSSTVAKARFRWVLGGHLKEKRQVFYLLDDIARQFRLFELRDNLEFRRDIFRAACLRAVDAGLTNAKDLLSELRRLAYYKDMLKNDRAAYRQWETWLRRIIRGWHLLSHEDREQFRVGKLQLSGAVKRIRAAEKLANARKLSLA